MPFDPRHTLLLLALPLALAAGCADGSLDLDGDGQGEGDDDASTDPLEVAFDSPEDGAQVAGTTEVGASASGGASPYALSLQVDGQEIETEDGADVTFSWDTTAFDRGEHTLTIVVADGDGDTATAEITVTVDQPPTVTVTSPAEGATVVGEILLAADASDDGDFLVVEAQIDGIPFASDDAAPYEGIADSCDAPTGVHTLTAVATDSAGQSATDSVDVTIERPDGDGDGVDVCEDCDDTDPDVHPGAEELCGDAVDQDCDGSLGECPVEADDLVGRTFGIDYGTGYVAEPKGVGSYLDPYLGYIGVVLARVAGYDEVAGAIDILLGPAVYDGDLAQDACLPTALMEGEAGSFTNPGFEVGPTDLYVGYGGFYVDLEESTLSGDFAGVSAIAEGTLRTAFDTRFVDDFLGGEGTTCGYIETVGISCEECPDDGEPYCLRLAIGGLVGEETDSVDLVARSDEDIAADPACE